MRITIKEKKIFKNFIKEKFGMKVNHIDSFCTDSRETKENDIFIAMKGSNLDSHQFIYDVIKKRAAIIFSEIDIDDKSIIKVKSTKNMLKEISIDWMKHFKNPTIAITGSNGKTTTKEMIREIFNYVYKTNYTIGNYNSTIGLAVNLFNFSIDADVNILELGANNPGEIEYLCDIVKPNYSIITNPQLKRVLIIVHPIGFEPITSSSVVRCSPSRNAICSPYLFPTSKTGALINNLQ